MAGTSTKFTIASLQSSQHAASCNSGLVICFCTCCVSFRATSCVFGDWSFLKLLTRSGQALLSECVTVSDPGHGLRVIHVLVVEGIAHVQALREGSRSGLSMYHQTSASHCGTTRSADPRTQTRLQASFSPSHLAPAGAGNPARAVVPTPGCDHGWSSLNCHGAVFIRLLRSGVWLRIPLGSRSHHGHTAGTSM